MAKCLYLHNGDIESRPFEGTFANLDFSFLQDNIRTGESLLNLELEKLSHLSNDIIIRYLAVQRSIHDDCLKLDCVQIQDSILAKLKELDSRLEKLLAEIINSKVPNYSKHRYFILLSTGLLDQVKRSIQTLGRLPDLDFSIFLEERRKPLISPESTAIHISTHYWSDVISILDRLRQQSKTVFSDEHDFICELDFNTASHNYCRVFLLDLTLMSYVLFDRLAKFEDLKRGFPFLCPCQLKTYYRTLRKLYSLADNNPSVLYENLATLLRIQDGLWPQTDSLRFQDVIPMEPCFRDSPIENLASFVFWHLYGLEKYSKEEDMILLAKCSRLKLIVLKKLLNQFDTGANTAHEYFLSPFQEERLKLILLIVNWFCEKDNSALDLIVELLEFIDLRWSTIGVKYFEKDSYRVMSLNMFQLFTKIINEIDPIYTKEGQAQIENEETLSESQKKLRLIWEKILERMNKGQTAPPAVRDGKQIE